MHGMATDMHQVFVSAPRASSRDRDGAVVAALEGAEDFPAAALVVVVAARSNCKWCARRDSNSQPSAPKADALSS